LSLEWPWLEEDEEEQLEALSLPQALGGILMALTPEGDIAYLTENVTHHLGLPHVNRELFFLFSFKFV